MTLFKQLVCLISVLILSACSSTSNNDYNVIERDYLKKPLVSDHQLKLSLLNRPIPQDQLMMLAFAQARQEQQKTNELAFVNYVQIKGERGEDENDVPSSRRVSFHISQDNNAVSILGPSQL
ncbi:hypothetical protein [Thalassotalea sp. PLHSN55]|uniref:hypothetical protein n=1 Tax=Thalassotalea sp. PLHSN55 TaxID=3435888 RepID=UPI003F840069